MKYLHQYLRYNLQSEFQKLFFSKSFCLDSSHGG